MAEGWLLAIAVIVMSSGIVLVMHYHMLCTQRIGMRCRVACCSLMYRKVSTYSPNASLGYYQSYLQLLRLSKTSANQTQAGQVVNLLSNDVARFDIVPIFLHYVWIMPIQAVVATVVMYDMIGPAAFAGLLALTIQAVPLQGTFLN